jgi:hypothetical protein
MSEAGNDNQASQYLHNVRKVLEIAASKTDMSAVLEAAYGLAEAFLSFEPYTNSQLEHCDLIFFLQTLWCNPNDQGIEQATREFEAHLGGESPEVQVWMLTGLRNVLCAATLVPSIREELRDPGNISNLINASLVYELLDCGNDWDELEEWDCLKIFVGGAWKADDEGKRQVVADELQSYIESSSIEPPESIFEALYNERITIPNNLWNEP